MADSAVSLLDAAGATVSADTFTMPSGDHRQAVVVGDPAVTAVAEVADVAQFPGALTNVAGSKASGSALNVNVNAIQKATYHVATLGVATAALTANTRKDFLSLEHAVGSTKTVRVRRIIVGGFQTTALAGSAYIGVYRGTAASSAGTVVTAVPSHPASAAADVVAKTLPTIVAATLLYTSNVGNISATAQMGFESWVAYDWQESGETIPFILRAGNLDTLAIAIFSSVAWNLTMQMQVILTEE